MLGDEDEHRSFFKCIGFLVQEGAIAADDRQRWEAARRLRNSSSHPERASVMPPGAIASMIKKTATDINSLFRTVAQLGERAS